jgi:hypothetical protein
MQRGNLRMVKCAKVKAADCVAGPVKIYTPARGELILAVCVMSWELIDINAWLFVISPDAQGPNQIQRAQVGNALNKVLGSDSFSGNFLPIWTPVYVANSLDPPPKIWKPNSPFVSGDMINEATHQWSCSVDGVSGATKPDFAANLNGSVTDGTTGWTDWGPISTVAPTVGSLTAGLLVSSS